MSSHTSNSFRSLFRGSIANDALVTAIALMEVAEFRELSLCTTDEIEEERMDLLAPVSRPVLVLEFW